MRLTLRYTTPDMRCRDRRYECDGGISSLTLTYTTPDSGLTYTKLAASISISEGPSGKIRADMPAALQPVTGPCSWTVTYVIRRPGGRFCDYGAVIQVSTRIYLLTYLVKAYDAWDAADCRELNPAFHWTHRRLADAQGLDLQKHLKTNLG